jgi:two-component system response regulator AtoC
MGIRTLSRPESRLVDFHGIRTVSPRMLEFFELIVRVARTGSSVLIRGQTGTGKELVARAIHKLGARSRRPFRAINCATLTPELLASELFGHVRGAFTGAVRDRLGLFAVADSGTVFLDEVAEIPRELQARLLRLVQEQSFIPVGGTDPVKVDVRIVSATHRALRREVEEHRFRADLMYRLRVVPVFLPPLARRVGDVEALAWHFIERFNGRGERIIETVDEDAMDALLGYPWPGNVRELRNVIEYAYAVGLGDSLALADLTPELRGEPPPDEPSYGPRPVLISDLIPDSVRNERARIQDALRQAGGGKAAAAKILGMSRSTLWRKLREYGLN